MTGNAAEQVVEVGGHAAGDMSDQLQVGILAEADALLTQAGYITNEQEGDPLRRLRTKTIGALSQPRFATALELMGAVTME